MELLIPHKLGKAEAKQRIEKLAERGHAMLPDKIGNFTVTWQSDDELEAVLEAMGASVPVSIKIGENDVQLAVELPVQLAMFSGMIENTVQTQAERLLQ